jgi:hypothetical protein
LFNEDSKKFITGGTYRVRDNVSVRLVVNDDYASYREGIKYVYVFAADKSGRMSLYYPAEGDGNVANRFPKYEGDRKWIKEVIIYPSYEVGEPIGTDNFFLLTSNEQIPNYEDVFQQNGVNDGIAKRGIDPKNPLFNLLDMGNAGSRGLPSKLPATWTLQKVSMRCTH